MLQELVEYLVTWEFWKLYLIWKGISENIFEDCVIILIYVFVLKRNFVSKKVFGKEFYTDKLKEGFLLSLLELEVQTVYKKDFKRFYWSFLFVHKHGFNLLKKRNFIIWLIGFHYWENCVSFLREKTEYFESVIEIVQLWQNLRAFIILYICLSRSVVVRRKKILFFWRGSVLSESRRDKDVVCVSKGVGHSVWVTCN